MYCLAYNERRQEFCSTWYKNLRVPLGKALCGRGAARARVYGIRYVVSFTALAAALPLISIIYERWGFDTLFYVLSAAAAVILALVTCLPRRMPVASAAAA